LAKPQQQIKTCKLTLDQILSTAVRIVDKRDSGVVEAVEPVQALDVDLAVVFLEMVVVGICWTEHFRLLLKLNITEISCVKISRRNEIQSSSAFGIRRFQSGISFSRGIEKQRHVIY